MDEYIQLPLFDLEAIPQITTESTQPIIEFTESPEDPNSGHQLIWIEFERLFEVEAPEHF